MALHPKRSSVKDESFDWNQLAHQQQVTPRLWRDFSDTVYKRLFKRWLNPGSYHRALKTDLFDEAYGCGLVSSLSGLVDEVHGMDISPRIVKSAQQQHPELKARVEDVRDLSYPSDTFDLVISNSTLDHFQSQQDIDDSLAELFRVLRPGGTCLLSLDNLSNPIVRLRGALPFSLLHRVGILPYYVGHTLTPSALRRALCHAGFELREQSVVMHVPRLPAVWLCVLTESLGTPRLKSLLLAFFSLFEKLEHWPLRNLSGYFTACLVVKPHPDLNP